MDFSVVYVVIPLVCEWKEASCERERVREIQSGRGKEIQWFFVVHGETYLCVYLWQVEESLHTTHIKLFAF